MKIAAWISAHADLLILIGTIASIVFSAAKQAVTPAFEENRPLLTKVIRVGAKLTADVLGAIVEAKKKPAPPSNPTLIIMPEDPKS